VEKVGEGAQQRRPATIEPKLGARAAYIPVTGVGIFRFRSSLLGAASDFLAVGLEGSGCDPHMV
jgi:hypothetical protein